MTTEELDKIQIIATKKDKEDKMCEENWYLKEQSVVCKTWKLQGMDHIFRVTIQMKELNYPISETVK